MFFEATIRNLTPLVFWIDRTNRRPTRGQFSDISEHGLNNIVQILQRTILGGDLRKSNCFFLCPNIHCPSMHLRIPTAMSMDPDGQLVQQYLFTSLAECRCDPVMGDENRASLLEIRQKVELMVKDQVINLVNKKDNLTITFICSGRLLSELISLIHIFDIVKENRFTLAVNFVDVRYSEYISLASIQGRVKGLNEQGRDREDPELQNLLNLLEEHLNVIVAGGPNEYRAAGVRAEDYFNCINSVVLASKAILSTKQNINMTIGVFSDLRDYERVYLDRGKSHDILVGQDMVPIWDSMQAVHRSVGNENSLSVAWSKSVIKSKLDDRKIGIIGSLDYKSMRREGLDWTTESYPLEPFILSDQEVEKSSTPPEVIDTLSTANLSHASSASSTTSSSSHPVVSVEPSYRSSFPSSSSSSSSSGFDPDVIVSKLFAEDETLTQSAFAMALGGMDITADPGIVNSLVSSSTSSATSSAHLHTIPSSSVLVERVASSSVDEAKSKNSGSTASTVEKVKPAQKVGGVRRNRPTRRRGAKSFKRG